MSFESPLLADGKTRAFLSSKFSEYYREHYSTIKPPPSIEMREFGLIPWNVQTMVRHRSCKTNDDLTRLILSISPSDVYYSSAYYMDPELEMEEKGWMGADLIFDIDADHLDVPCRTEHDFWVCGNCRFTGKGVAPKTCPSCQSEKVVGRTWICDVCLGRAKEEALKLLAFLIEDFGIQGDSIHVVFSGHRGYHVHVTSEEVRGLGSDERREIVDYVTGVGIIESLGLQRDRGVLCGPDPLFSGWRGRIGKELMDLLRMKSLEELKKMGLSHTVAKQIVELRDSSPLKLGLFGGPPESWEKFIEMNIVKNVASHLDSVVTIDTHRLIRLVGTLNGKTGLRATEVPLHRLKDFDPFVESIAFGDGELKVKVSRSPQLRVGGKDYDPFDSEVLDLPSAVAVLLMAKGVATLG